MEFLLECIGFPPDYDLEELVERIRREGEPIAWRGPSGEHLRLPLTGGLEVHLDREADSLALNVWPHYRSPHRLRVAVESISPVPDSPFDGLLRGSANPAPPGGEVPGECYNLSAFVIDRRRVPSQLPCGHVLAVSLSGFALDVAYVGPNQGVRDAAFLDNARGASIVPLGGPEDPGGCMEVSLRVREVRHLVNPITSMPVEVLETDAPGRPLLLFLSRWQLEKDGLPTPRPGWRVEGAFLFTGRVSGGLPSAVRRANAFG